MQAQQVEQEIRQWLQQVIVGLNLCPFAARPLQDDRVRIQVAPCKDEAALLQLLHDEILLLQETPARDIETTLIVLTDVLLEFDEFNQFLDMVDALLADRDWQGEFQIATFHPQYCFAGVSPDSAENLTNRSPYPVLHILREATLEKALTDYPNPEEIPERNIKRMSELTAEEIRRLFPYL